MIALLAAALLAPAPGLPTGTARYRVELAGAPVGVAELSMDCAPRQARGERPRGGPATASPRCTVSWEARLRLPAASGGAVRSRRISAPVDREGRLSGAPVIEVDGVRRRAVVPLGLVPASAAELALSARAGRCVAVVDEESGRTGRACARRQGASFRAEVLGAAEEWTLGGDGFPDQVELGDQGVRYLRDPAAEVPAAPPPLEVRVPGPPAGRMPRRFCGRAPDAPGPGGDLADLAALPRPVPDGSSCREQAEAYAALVRRTGLSARIALGVADDGAGFVWHAWVEARTRRGWVAVDPAFGELPAHGPRFTVARHGGDVAGVAEAGREILRCWGRAAVE